MKEKVIIILKKAKTGLASSQVTNAVPMSESNFKMKPFDPRGP